LVWIVIGFSLGVNGLSLFRRPSFHINPVVTYYAGTQFDVRKAAFLSVSAKRAGLEM
jgi:hypothetical protein